MAADILLDRILVELLMLDGNESTLIEDQHNYELFKELIIALTKIKYDIRYCSNESCSCHPESLVKALISQQPLTDFLCKYGYKKIISDIESLTVDYEIVTVWTRYKLEG